MGVAAYTSLVSLMNVLTRFQHPTCPVPFNHLQIQTLLEKVNSLVEFFENDSQTSAISTCSTVHDLEMKMVRTAHAVEDLLETSYVNRVLGIQGLELCPDLRNVIQEMKLIIQESSGFKVKRRKNDNQEKYGIRHKDSSRLGPRDKYFMVGFDKQLSRLMDQIKMRNPSCIIIPIVGMGGIGKTTLATNVCDSPYALSHFDVRALVTISQHYIIKNIIFLLLCCIHPSANDQLDVEILGDELYKSLYGRRYLIILDDIWGIQVWDEMRKFFPDNDNGSRILLTTRIRGVAYRVGPSSTYEMRFMDDDESFALLSNIVYGSENFPCELEILGRAIAKSCKGLPLAVEVIGGLLKMCSKTLEYWKDFAGNLSSIISKDHSGQCLGILYLSYNSLPIHLKPLFLHMATFEEDEEIPVPHLFRLWISEGFLKPTEDRILEVVALEFLNDLVDRNLVIVKKRGLTQKIKTVMVHDLLRELSLREAQKDNFVCTIEDDTANLPQRLEFERRIIYIYSADTSIVPFPSMPHARSLYQIGYKRKSRQLVCICHLLRVMNVKNKSKLPSDFLLLVNIRYLEVAICREDQEWLLLSLSLFWNLETLILTRDTGYGRVPVILTSKIWELPNLRHIEFKVDVFLPDPTGGQIVKVLKNLQTVHNVIDFFCTDEVFRLIPNLKELSISYNVVELKDCDKMSNSLTNLALLQKLEILKVYFKSLRRGTRVLSRLEKLSFSPNLIELELYNSGIHWENMTIVGSLANLEVLVLKEDAFYGIEWNTSEGEFQRLKHLSINDCHLSIWNVESCHFPKLEHLKLQLWDLKDIPLEIGEILSLELLELITGEKSVLISAKKTLEERKNQGDCDLLVKCFYVGGSSKVEVDKWVEADNNFKIFVTPYML